MQGVKAQLSLDEANRLQHSMRIFSSPSTRAGMSRCRLHAVLHTAAGKQDPRGWCCTAAQEKKRREKKKKTKEETAPFSVNLMQMPSFIPAQYCSSQEQRPTLTFRDRPSYKCQVQAKAMDIWGLRLAPTNWPQGMFCHPPESSGQGQLHINEDCRSQNDAA